MNRVGNLKNLSPKDTVLLIHAIFVVEQAVGIPSDVQNISNAQGIGTIKNAYYYWETATSTQSIPDRL